MRKAHLPVLVVLLALVLATAAWAATASFTPRPGGADIFAVVNADRSPGVRVTRIGVSWGRFQKVSGRGNPYGNCSGATAGWVLLVRATNPRAQLFTLTTNGTIVRPPYQGFAPPEISHACYKLEKMRAVF